jgi:hypothetical protein
MAITARVIGDLGMVTGMAAQHMSSQRRAAALFDGGHDLELAYAQVTLLSVPPSRSVGAEDIRHLQGGTGHGRPLAGWG